MVTMLALSLALSATDAPRTQPIPPGTRSASLIESELHALEKQRSHLESRFPAATPLILGLAVGGGLIVASVILYLDVGLTFSSLLWLPLLGLTGVGVLIAGVGLGIIFAVINGGRAERVERLTEQINQSREDLERAREFERQGAVSMAPLANPLFTF